MQENVEDNLPALSEGANLYKSIKSWTKRVTSRWATREGDKCNANSRQVLALIRMRKGFLSDGMRNGRDATTKSEWVKEWKMIRDKFGNVIDVKTKISNFDEDDSNQIYCEPHKDGGEDFVFNGDDRLICSGSECVSCKNKPPPDYGTETFR